LIGIVVVIEGALLMSMAAPAKIENYGSLREFTVTLAGLQLAALGALIAISWLVVDLKFIVSRDKVRKAFFIFITAVNVIVMIEGLLLTISAEAVTFEGGDRYGHVAAAMLSMQLFAIGAFSLLLWLERSIKPTNLLSWVVGMGSAVSLASIGALIIGVASPLDANFLTNIGEGKMTIAGVFLMALSLVFIIGFMMDGTRFGKRKPLKIFFEVYFIVVALLFAFGSAYLSALASHFELGDFFSAGQMYMAAFFAVTFMLSVLVLAAWFTRSRTFSRGFIVEGVGISIAIALAGIGIEVFGLAGRTVVQDLFTLPHGIVLMIGAQLVVLPCAIVMFDLLRGKEHFRSQTVTSVMDIALLLIPMIIASEGLVIMISSARVVIDNGYGFLEQTVFAFGAIVTIFGILMMAAWCFRDSLPSPRLRRIEILATVFFTLMFAAAFVI